jgi:hypothetical protein
LSLPHKAFSDRLSHDFDELMRVTRKMAEAVYRNNGYRAAPKESGKKPEAVIAYCRQHGIVIHERCTWMKLPEKAECGFLTRRATLLLLHPVPVKEREHGLIRLLGVGDLEAVHRSLAASARWAFVTSRRHE